MDLRQTSVLYLMTLFGFLSAPELQHDFGCLLSWQQIYCELHQQEGQSAQNLQVIVLTVVTGITHQDTSDQFALKNLHVHLTVIHS